MYSLSALKVPCAVLLALIASGTACLNRDNKTQLPGIGYLGTGYNIYEGNPLANQGLLDKGFRHKVLDLTYNEGRHMADGSWLIPDATSAVEVANCDTNFKTQAIHGPASYAASLKNSISATIPGWGQALGAVFSASTAYANIEETTSNKDKIVLQAMAKCSIYRVLADAFVPPRVKSDFVDGLKRLPTTYSVSNADKFIGFIDSYGTHVMWGAEFGGIRGQESTFTRTSWHKLEKMGFDLSAGAKSAAVLSAEANLTTAAEHSRAASYSDEREEKYKFYNGGKYSSDRSEWMAAVRSEPMPIFYHLWPLDELLQPRFMPDPDNVDTAELAAKRESLRTALASYCAKELLGRKVSSCEAPVDPAPVPPVEVWLPWASTIERPYGRHLFHECPEGSYVTDMRWKERTWYGITELLIQCSDPLKRTFKFTNTTKGGWNARLQCSNGISQIQAAEQEDFGVVNVKAACLGTNNLRSSNGNEKGDWHPVLTCPDAAPVIVGVEILKKSSHGVYNFRAKCTNAVATSRRLHDEFLI